MKKIIIFIYMLGLFFSLAAQEACPDVIPALQQWKGGKGNYAYPAKDVLLSQPPMKKNFLLQPIF